MVLFYESIFTMPFDTFRVSRTSALSKNTSYALYDREHTLDGRLTRRPRPLAKAPQTSRDR